MFPIPLNPPEDSGIVNGARCVPYVWGIPDGQVGQRLFVARPFKSDNAAMPLNDSIGVACPMGGLTGIYRCGLFARACWVVSANPIYSCSQRFFRIPDIPECEPDNRDVLRWEFRPMKTRYPLTISPLAALRILGDSRAASMARSFVGDET
jgi:hypothetical protein